MYMCKQTLGLVGNEKVPIRSMPDGITSLFDQKTCMTCVCAGVHGIEHVGKHNEYKKISPQQVQAKIKDADAFKALF